jgi:hypothetical protein
MFTSMICINIDTSGCDGKQKNPIIDVQPALGRPSTQDVVPGGSGGESAPGSATTTQNCEWAISSSDIALHVDYFPICEVPDW